MIHPPHGLRASRPSDESPGTARAIFSEVIDPAAPGPLQIRRAGRVEPDAGGLRAVDLGPSGGPVLGPLALRGRAIEAEVAWLTAHRLGADG